MNEQHNEKKTRINENGLKVSDDETPVFLTGNSSLQSPSEAEEDKSRDPRQDVTMEASGDDLRETAADRLAGSDRAGTAERKDNNMSDDDNEE